MASVDIYPMDFAALQKGDCIPVERLTEIVGANKGTDKYTLRVLALSKRIEDELAARGRPVTTRINHGAIEILTDAQASACNGARFKSGIRKSVRSHARALAVDQGALTKDERDEHNKRLTSQGKILAGIREARAELRQEPVKRITPGIVQSQG